MGVRPNADWSSHIPVLIRALDVTDGPVLELGLGAGSTPLMHAICHEQGRHLVSYEHNERFVRHYIKYRSKDHEIIHVPDWDDMKLDAYDWSVVLVDHAPAERRIVDIKKLLNAELLVVHDTQPQAEKDYHYSEIYPLFKYRWDYTKLGCHAAVLSNVRRFPWRA